MTLPELFALACGKVCAGENRCRFCGSPASLPHTLSESFTAIDTLTAPQSPFICEGCVLCLQEEGQATLADGELRDFTRSFRRSCSWVITKTGLTGATKAHTSYLRDVILNPPEPPFAISIALSGQKHVLYRGTVCHDRDYLAVTLEGERIYFARPELQDRMNLCGHLIASTGKPALENRPDFMFWNRVAKRYTHWSELCTEWEKVWETPLSRLAVFLSPKKEDCERVFTNNLASGIS